MNKLINKLIEGNQRFINKKDINLFNNHNRLEELSKGQNPDIVILSCADSRVSPEIIFDSGLGELFTIRVAGNIANKSTIAGIEFAVEFLKAKLLVVMGHEDCGAVSAAVSGGDYSESLNHLISYINPAISLVGSESELNLIIKTNAELNSKYVYDNSNIIKSAVDNNKLTITSAFFSLTNGEVDFCSED